MDGSAVCFSPGALALLSAIGLVIQSTIIALFIALQRSKDAQIKSEQDKNADLWEVVKPSIGIANHALDVKARRDPSGRVGR